MADTPNTDDIRKELEKQISDLKKEVTQMSKSLSERGGALFDSVRDGAEDAYDETSRRASKATRQMRHQAHVVSDAIRENPGTAATVLSSAGLLGFILGLVLGQALSSHDRSSHRWH
jgi:ElaB/YqjD/DUF883 family membrane-anchored ribosome-binding protein